MCVCVCLCARACADTQVVQGETFRLRREHSARQLEAMGIGAILATTVTRDMLEPDGFLDMCTAAPQTEVGAIGHKALSTTYFASALNHLHTYVHALRLGFGQLIVLEDDMTMALGEGSTAVAASVIWNLACTSSVCPSPDPPEPTRLLSLVSSLSL